MCRLSPVLVLSLTISASQAVAQTSQNALTKVLQREPTEELNRTAELARLRLIDDSNQTWWQSGFIGDGENRLTYEEAVAAARSRSAYSEYLERKASVRTLREHRVFSDWCREHRLNAEAEAHLLAAVANTVSPRETVMRRLGFERINGQWTSSDDRERMQAATSLYEQSLKKWGKTVRDIATGLSGSLQERTEALETLREMHDPDAVPALHVLARRNPDAARHAVRTLAQIKSLHAAEVLVTIALNAERESTRQVACQALQAHPTSTSVPLLVNEMQFEVEETPSIEVMAGACGNIYTNVTNVVRRENWDAVVIDERVVDRGKMHPKQGRLSAAEQASNTVALGPKGLINARTLAIAAQMQLGYQLAATRREAWVAARNAQIRETNRIIGAVLAEITGAEPSADPNYWREWWHAENDAEIDKALVVRTGEGEVRKANASLPLRYDARTRLAGDTLVLTRSGRKPASSVQAGDLLLSKNPETGRLEFRPVVRTTSGENIADRRIMLKNGRSICGSASQKVWCSGQGWKQFREVEAGDMLHTNTGSVEVRTVDPASASDGCSLLVAGVHTFFVGDDGILVHDMQLPRPTDSVVPGFDAGALQLKSTDSATQVSLRN